MTEIPKNPIIQKIPIIPNKIKKIKFFSGKICSYKIIVLSLQRKLRFNEPQNSYQQVINNKIQKNDR